MIEAMGKYSGKVGGLEVVVSSNRIVEIKLVGYTKQFTDGLRYRITAELIAEYSREKETRFRARVLSATQVQDSAGQDFARYKGVFRINEGAGSIVERQGGELSFYRGDAFSPELKTVNFEKVGGWVTVAIPKGASAYTYRQGDFIYVDGKLYHKYRIFNDVRVYELCVRAEHCYKIDCAEYLERVRLSRQSIYA